LKPIRWLSLFCIVFLGTTAGADSLKCPSIHNDALEVFGDFDAEVIPTAIIGPTNDWKYLRAAAKEWGISEDMVADILAAGLNLNCDGTTNSNPLTLNAWLIQGNKTKITTNSHAFYDENQKLREPIGECYAQSLADVLDSIDNPNPVTKAYLNASTLKAGTTDPYHDDPQADRATIELTSTLAASRPLALPWAPPFIAEGDEIFVVSRRPKSMRKDADDKEPMIFKTTAKKVYEQWEGKPGAIKAEIDGITGDSAALYLVRDKKNPGRLIPVGMHYGSWETYQNGTAVNHLPWNSKTNTSIGLVFDSNFYNF
jgi:hypothetical protein